jgi:hypothetical protein
MLALFEAEANFSELQTCALWSTDKFAGLLTFDTSGYLISTDFLLTKYHLSGWQGTEIEC